MLIDDVIIRLAAGRGGDGAVAFNKNMKSLGPAGGSGGKGGSVYFEGVSDLGALRTFRFRKEFRAEDGGLGQPQFRDGRDGRDLVLKVPIGTVAHNITTGRDIEVVNVGERILVTQGGHGGKGNFLFRSPHNTSPRRFQEGLAGESFEYHLELKLIAHVGLIGLPNAGKSSLLNELTNARAKVANYAFTTLEPNLGTYYDLVIADIPGLIEGASGGKGLGIKFLKHIERTKVLFHLISAESPTPVWDYRTVRKELGLFNKDLLKRPEYLFVSKSDLVPVKTLKGTMAKLRKLNPRIKAISIHDWDALNEVKNILNKFTDNKRGGK